MARSINSTVGKIGNPNMGADVRAVQEMLNNVDSNWGGPDPKLVVDGKTGPKLVTAIQEFQSENVGTSSETGKVTPNGETMARLNEYDPYPALTLASTLRCAHGGTITATVIPKPGGWAGGDATPLTTTDKFVIAGCPMTKPCVKVKWVASPCKTLDSRSSGLCLTNLNVPQGSVVIS